jgi:AcrR family transcriptional regulator
VQRVIPARRWTDRSGDGKLNVMAVRVSADVRRREVLESAVQLFDERGYHETNMNSVAKAVGVQKATLYHYFSSKSEILNLIHEEFIDLLLSNYESRPQGESAAEDLQAVMRDIIQLMDTHKGHVRVFFEHHRELSPENQASVLLKRDAYTDLVESIIVRGIENGEFRRVDPRLATLGMFGMCNWTYQWYRAGGGLESRAIADAFWDIFVHGLSANLGSTAA